MDIFPLFPDRVGIIDDKGRVLYSARTNSPFEARKADMRLFWLPEANNIRATYWK